MAGTEAENSQTEPNDRAGHIRRFSAKTLISRAGYGIMVALLAFSTIEAYWIQSALSREGIENYRQFLSQDEILFQSRQCVWRGAAYVRDFFLSSSPDRAALFRSQIAELRKDSLAELDRLNIAKQTRDRVRTTLTELWDALDRAAVSKAGLTGEAAREFVESEITPRRSAASEALRELTRAAQQATETSEAEFGRQRRAAARQILISLGVCLALGLLVAALSIRRTETLERERLRTYAAVAEARRELEQLSARLIEVQEEERCRLARELHDEIGQTLTAIRIEISRSISGDPSSPEARERMGRARELVERAIQTVRDISLLLRPSALDDLGLTPALQWHLQDFSRRSGIQCDFAEENVQDALPDAVKTCSYRVIQEALHNCEKHSGASAVRVRIRQTAGLLEAEVADNGRGVELGVTGVPVGSRGSGILGMRERVSTIGGSLSLQSSPGKGMRLFIRIPLDGKDGGGHER